MTWVKKLCINHCDLFVAHRLGFEWWSATIKRPCHVSVLENGIKVWNCMAWTGIVLNYEHAQLLPLFGPLLVFVTSNIGCGYWGRPIKVVFFYWHFWRALYLVHKFIIFHFLFNQPNSPNGNESSFKSYYHVNKIESRLLDYAHVGEICTL